MSLDPTSLPAKWHPNSSNDSSREHECDRQTTDRQTDHATEKCIAVGGIACIARAIPPNNKSKMKKAKIKVNDRSHAVGQCCLIRTMTKYVHQRTVIYPYHHKTSIISVRLPADKSCYFFGSQHTKYAIKNYHFSVAKPTEAYRARHYASIIANCLS